MKQVKFTNIGQNNKQLVSEIMVLGIRDIP
jgi:hypothetical protein